ncbi:methylated-DNA--protein-cysteine methyltransferase [Methanocaldococcus villosus KIN24-T80]|uniref:Methylated-DNA--protein-cysteine methyltransferase n=1 Tax=Methanocaldococcus villosus KIN24-T80 TaxID=1069083 RepID=N6UTK9_9EURY|nr:MGMT family protein [Methanocaldococcus villosus]ENN95664.1 methylated-DNA--protein-cysteine methyltransferase [Methanocaldococcus villosus KIN24-T80]
MIVEIDGYFIGLKFKDDYLVANTIPLKSKPKGFGELSDEYLDIAEIILKLYFAKMSDKEARKKVKHKLLVSPFIKKVLIFITNIPMGKTVTYGDVAKALNTSPRAVGRALNKNPLPLLYPCHRVVAKDSLGGYAYGLEEKKVILDREIKNFKYK